MKVSTKQIAEAVYQLASTTEDTEKLALLVAAYLVDEQKTNDTDRILREVERLRYERDGKLEIVATSKNELSESVKQAISRIFEAKDSTIIEEHDESVVGGVTVAAMDQWLDLSVRGQLNQLKNSNIRG